MKRAIYLAILALTAIICVLPCEAKKDKKSGEGKILFTTTQHNFGTIKEQGGPAKVEFEFVNQGNGNLIIADVTAQCGCTRPEFPKKPIAPGAKGKIKVTFNPIGRPGSFTKTINVYTTGKPKKTTLKIKGTVIPGK